MSVKVIVAAWGGSLAGSLLDGAAAQVCADAGVRRLQVNVSDAAVDGAMRISELDPPIDAVISVWFDDERAVAVGLPAVIAHLGRFCTKLAAWTVTERRPLDPDLPRDGSRIDALANVAFLRRPVDLAHDEWQRIWLDEHTAVAIDTQATFGYVQNIVADAVHGEGLSTVTPPVAAIVEELFPMEAVHDIHAFYGSAGDHTELESRMTAMIASVTRFGADRDLDVVPTSRYDRAW